MAITPIRQQRQAFTRRIGVVNVDTGASQVAETVQNVAESINSNLDPFLRQNALERGTNVAKEIKRQNLVTFDDKGEPVAMTVPREFGLVASQAYNAVIERRFEESMLDELQTKSIEIAKKYPSPAAYNQMMTKYLADMDTASSGRFNEFIASNGKEIYTKTLGKLQVAAEAARLKKVKEASRINMYTALKKVEATKALSFTPEGMAELKKAIEEANSANEQYFAINKDRLEYTKNIDLLRLHQAGGSTNMLMNDADQLSDSQRAIVAEAIKNPALLGSIENEKTRNAVRQIHNMAGYQGLDSLSESYRSGINALSGIESLQDSEWMSLNEPRIEKFQSTTFGSANEAIEAGSKIVNEAPDADKGKVNGKILVTLADMIEGNVSNHVTAFKISDEKQIQILSKKIQAALGQNDPNAKVVQELPASMRGNISQIIARVSEADRRAISENVNNFLDPTISAARLENEAIQADIERERTVREAAAVEKFQNLDGLIQEAISSENYEQALSLFNQIDPAHLPREQLNKYNKDKLAFSKQMSRLGGEKIVKEITKTEQSWLTRNIDYLNQVETLAEAVSVGGSIKMFVNNLAGNHTEDSKLSYLTKVNARLEKLTGEDQAKKNIRFERESQLVIGEFKDRMEAGEILSAKDLEAAKTEFKKTYKNVSNYSEQAIADAEAKLETFYALSVAKSINSDIKNLTDGKGLAPERLDEIVRLAQSGTQEAKAEVEKLQGAELSIARKLFAATSSFSAKSAVQTQINQITGHNKMLFDQHEAKLRSTDMIDEVVRLGQSASTEALKHYEETKLAPLAGYKPGQTIDYDDPRLLRDQSGNPTQFATELRVLMGRGIVPAGLAKYMNNAAQRGGAVSDNMFELFNMGSNTGSGGINLNIFRMENSPVDAKALARFGAAAIMYEAGMAGSPTEALNKIVSTANNLGENGIVGSIERIIATKSDKNKKLSDWVIENYPDADAQTRKQLEQAAIALGLEAATSEELKDRIAIWSDRVFGTDDKVIGNRLARGSGKLDIVRGARSKFLTNKQMKDMDSKAFSLLYQALDESSRDRLFTQTPLGALSKGTTGSTLNPYAMAVSKLSTAWPDTKITVNNQTLYPDFKLKYRQQFEGSSTYYVYVETNMGNSQAFAANGLPIVVDAMNFAEQPNVLPELGFYYTNWRTAAQKDPNGLKYRNESWAETAAQAVGGITLSEAFSGYDQIPAASQKTKDAEMALVFARFPERLREPENMEQFNRLIKIGVIPEEHRESFMRFVEDD